MATQPPFWDAKSLVPARYQMPLQGSKPLKCEWFSTWRNGLRALTPSTLAVILFRSEFFLAAFTPGTRRSRHDERAERVFRSLQPQGVDGPRRGADPVRGRRAQATRG